MATYNLKKSELDKYIQNNPNAQVKILSGPSGLNDNYISQLREQGIANLAQQDRMGKSGLQNGLEDIGKSISQLPRAISALNSPQGARQNLTLGEQQRFKADPLAFTAQSAASTASYLPLAVNPLLGGVISGVGSDFGQQDLRKGLDVGSLIKSGVVGGVTGYAGGKALNYLGGKASKLIPQGAKDILNTPLNGATKATKQAVTGGSGKIASSATKDLPSTVNDYKKILSESQRLATGTNPEQALTGGTAVEKLNRGALKNVSRNIGMQEDVIPGSSAQLAADEQIGKNITQYYGEKFDQTGLSNVERTLNDTKNSLIESSTRVNKTKPFEIVDEGVASDIVNGEIKLPKNVTLSTAQDFQSEAVNRMKKLLPENSSFSDAPRIPKVINLSDGELQVLKKGATKGYLKATNYTNPSKELNDLLDEQLYKFANNKLSSLPGYSDVNALQSSLTRQLENTTGVANRVKGVEAGYSPINMLARNVAQPIANKLNRGVLAVTDKLIPNSLPASVANKGTSILGGFKLPSAGNPTMLGMPTIAALNSGNRNQVSQPNTTSTDNPFVATQATTDTGLTPEQALAIATQANGGKLNAFTLSLADYLQKANGKALTAAQQTNLTKINNAKSLLGALYDQYSQLQGVGSRVGGAISNVAAGLGGNAQLQAYNSTVQSAKPLIARALGQLGNLSVQEQQDVLNAIPNAQTTPEEAAIQWQTLGDLLSSAEANIKGQ